MTALQTETRPRKPARPRSFACPQCGGVIQVRANGISVSAVCASCGSTVDVASPELTLIAQARQGTRTLDIPIGTRGTLFGTSWEVIGYQLRRNTDRGSWEEYLLFNPWRGFRFLVHDDEGWSVFVMLREDVRPPPQDAIPGESEVRTEYVLGEFYWRARTGDVAQVTEFADGSRMLVRERTGDEIVWSRGVSASESVVRSAFGLAERKPAPHHETERARTGRVARTAVWALVALALLKAVPFGRSHALPVYDHAYTVAASDRGRTVVSDPFEVPDSGGNVRIEVHAPLSNDWLELGLALEQEPGGLSFVARPTLEHYFGYDSDGSWSEGGDDGAVTFRSVPGGTYRLLIDPDSGTLARASAPVRPSDKFGLFASAASAPQPSISFAVTVRRHVLAPELFWIALALLLPYPAFRLLFRRRNI